jgi:small nuclear ribonucleoprotein (snRNP)-like protein
MGQKKVINKAIARLKRLKSSAEFAGRAGARGKMRAQIQNLRALRSSIGSGKPQAWDTQKPVTGKWGAKSKVMMTKTGNRLVKVAGVRRHETLKVAGVKNVVGKDGQIKSKPSSRTYKIRGENVRLITKKAARKLGLTKYVGGGVSRAGGRGGTVKRKPGGGGGGRGTGGVKRK